MIGQRGDDATKIITLDVNVAVIDQQVLIMSRWKHLLQIADLHIGAEFVWANDQTDPAVRKFALQLLHAGDGGVFGMAHTKNNFVLGIVLQAVAAEAFVDVRVGAFQRLENGDRGQRSRGGRGRPPHTTLAQKNESAPQANQVIDRTRDAAKDSYDLKDSDGGVNHARAQTSLFVP